MATTRTDIHRPSAPEFDPAAYDLHGVFDLEPEWNAAAENAARMAAVNALSARGYRFAGRTRACGHCGVRIRYGALMAREDVKEMIYIGETCLDGRFSLSQDEYRAGFRRVRDRAAAGRQRAAHVGLVAAFRAENPEVAAILATPEIVAESPDFLADIAVKVERFGSLTDRQIAAVLRAGAAIRRRLGHTRPTRPVVTDAPKGRAVIVGEVVFTKLRDTVLNMRVRTDAGYVVWLPAPEVLGRELRGRRVRFVTYLTPSRDDKAFAFGSRALDAEFVD